MSALGRRDLLGGLVLLPLAGCGSAGSTGGQQAMPGYRWTRLVEAAPFPGSYGFPVHALGDGRFMALHPRGSWSTREGREWVREALPPSDSANAYASQFLHDGETWVLGAVQGNYLDFRFESAVRRTRGHRVWETLGRSDTLPRLIFTTPVSFRRSIWLFGGFDGKAPSNAIWRSRDGLAWERVVEHAPWQPGSGGRAVLFKDRLWLIGGGTIDGPIRSEVWSSADGLAWTREAEKLAEPQPFGFTPQLFDGKIWLVGANRSGAFTNEMLVSDDGRSWQPVRAPWSPRGAPAVWSDGRRMYLTGGKYSTPDPATGEPRFIYSNDVWAMERAG